MVLFDPRNDPNTVPNANQDLLFKKYMQWQGANPTTPTQATDNLASINAKTNSTNVGNARTPWVPNLWFSKPTNTASLTGVKPVTTSKSTIATPAQTLPDYSTWVTPGNINAVTQANMNNLQQNTIAGVEDIWKQHNETQGQLQMQQMIANNQTTNGLDVLRTQQSVQDQITQGITNPQQIANNTGIPLAIVNQVLTGKDYQNVTLTQEAAKPIMTPLERLSQDVELAKKRNFEDMQTNIDRLTRDTTRAVDSLQAELARNIRSTQVAGALTSQSMASWFNIGIRNIMDGANENILRIKEGYADNIEDVQRLKNRMLEDYTMQMARATEDTKSNLDKLRLQTLSQLQDINEKFGINDDRTYTALQKLFQDAENSKLAIINNSADLMLRANADARANIDQVNKLQNDIQNLWNGYVVKDGQVYSAADLAKQQQQWWGSIWSTSKVMNLGSNPYNNPSSYTGHDFAAPFGSPIDSPVAGTITKVEKQKDGNNQVQIKTSDWFTVSINHVSDAILQYADQMIWQQVKRGDIIGYVGNSGNVMTADGKRLRKDWVVQWPEAQALLNQWRGSHMDVRIIDPNGQRVTGNNVVSYLQNGWSPIGQNKDGSYIYAQRQTQQSTSNPIQSRWVSDPTNPEFIAFNRTIRNQIPTALQNSDYEQKNLETTIKTLWDQWMTPRDASLLYMWVNIPDEKNKQIAEKLLAPISQQSNDIPWSYFTNLSANINKWEYGDAVRLTEKTILDTVKNAPIRESTVITATKRANELLGLINEYENKIGPLEGNLSQIGKGIFGDKQAQKLATKMTQAIAQMRNDLIGSQMTKEEKQTIINLLPSPTDPAENLTEKLLNIKEAPLLEYNSLRQELGLPQLSEQQLLDINTRAQLYGVGGFQSPSSTQSTSPSVWNDLISKIQNILRQGK